MEALSQELYKSLKAESTAYHDKIQTLWLTKFSLSGAVVAFMLINRDKFDTFEGGPLAGVALIPILSLVIDLKVAEYGLHARAISQFIARTFSDVAVREWERVLWGDTPSPERRLVQLRSVLTVFAAAVPTIAMMLLACVVFIHAGFEQLALIGGGMIALYAAAVTASTILILRSRPDSVQS